ncbi:GMC oxidoreductase [Stipitochalara longipes BDJ]|nr:GMC oxidoreductase [Stipitochalara longipes BDJ]
MDTRADFIIIGGGTAGLLLASRLAHSRRKPSVLVIEAGKDRFERSYRIPADRFSLAFTNPELDHGYTTVPQTELGGRELAYARGKGLGGSTLNNFMIYLSGSKGDYDHWADLVGDQSWGWEECHRRFKEIENFHGSVPAELKHLADPNLREHGNAGPVEVSLPTSWEKGVRKIMEDVVKTGVPINLDINSGNPIGIGMGPIFEAHGYRTTSASANLKDVPDNFHTWTEATVSKIIFEGTRALGVQTLDGRKAFANHEIILTAGSFNTPKLLMLSGIGDRDSLAKHNIPLIKNLPGVGQNVKDHPAVFLTALMDGKYFHRAAFESSPSLVAAAQAQWEQNGTGEMSQQFSSLPFMFNKLSKIYDTPEFSALDKGEKEYLLRKEVPSYEAAFMGPKLPPMLEVPEGKEYLSLVAFAMNPQGSGTVTIASSDPNDAAIIDPKVLSHPFDKLVMVEALIDAIRIFQETEIYKKGFEGWLNGPKSLEREVVEKIVEEQALLVWHANGSVKMGRGEEEGACVNDSGRVFGLQGLRVADMSVSPVTINGHTAAAAYLIGATISEKIIEEYKL